MQEIVELVLSQRDQWIEKEEVEEAVKNGEKTWKMQWDLSIYREVRK